MEYNKLSLNGYFKGIGDVDALHIFCILFMEFC
jgi:hypothetical protein